MNRRRFLAGCGCMLPALAWAQQSPWQMPARFSRPETASDEGGLWSLMDREETRLRRSPFTLRDPALHKQVHSIACRLAGEHCADIRVYLVNTPLFNASMAPNGMMQVWTGLLLRVENEAQLAAVIGHEIGHYVARHSVERLRDAKSRSAFMTFLGLFGVVGLVGQIGMLAGMFAYNRDHEREADAIGASLMRNAGYDIAEAAKVWENLQLEIKARPDAGGFGNPLFATHPASEERQQTLAELAKASPGGDSGEAAWRAGVRPFLRGWLAEEVKRGQHEESLALLGRAIERAAERAEFLHARAEVYRLRSKDNDLEAALGDYRAALAAGDAPPESHRGIGMIHRAQSRLPEAKASFERYLELAPDAPDSAMIRSYL